MALDSYALCICGSGKKLKFCCQDVLPELSRASTLRENQPEVALELLRTLQKRFPDKESVVRELMGVLLDLRRHNEAVAVGADFLKAHPDHPMMLLLVSELRLVREGFEATRRLLHRAFQISSRQYPEKVAGLAYRVAMEMLQRGSILAGREHLALSLRLSRGETQQTVLSRLMSVEGDRNLPAMCRTTWSLLPIAGSDEVVLQDQRARKLCLLGCWEPASILYNRLADQLPTEGAVWFNLGLCQLWDGRDREGASSLHHAATLLTDAEQATDAEALAQMVDQLWSQERVYVVTARLQVRSVSELVSRLRDAKNVRFLKSHDHEDCEHFPGTDHVSEVVLLQDPVGTTGLSALPESLADLDVFDVVDAEAAAASDISSPWIDVTTSEALLERSLQFLREVLGDLIVTSAGAEVRERVSSEPPMLLPFELRHVRPDEMSSLEYRRLLGEGMSAGVEVWLSQPLAVLGNRSPLEAAGVPELRRCLTAAVLVLHDLLRRRDMDPAESVTFERLQLPARAAFPFDGSVHLGAFNSLSLGRIDVDTASGNLRELGSRLGMMGYVRLAERCFDRLLEQNQFGDWTEAVSACQTRASLARVSNNLELACSMLDRARGLVTGPDAFRIRLELDIRHLSYLLDDVRNPAVKSLLHRFRDQYLMKVPELRELLADQLTAVGATDLLSELDGGLAGGAGSGGGLWLPGSSAEAPAAGGGQLWLPGQ
ncbi:protein disulfide-isomerase [Planctomycetia bacterium]|nr:protein disulfide-isomerase [Planctomycetia bacterium]